MGRGGKGAAALERHKLNPIPQSFELQKDTLEQHGNSILLCAITRPNSASVGPIYLITKSHSYFLPCLWKMLYVFPLL